MVKVKVRNLEVFGVAAPENNNKKSAGIPREFSGLQDSDIDFRELDSKLVEELYSGVFGSLMLKMTMRKVLDAFYGNFCDNDCCRQFDYNWLRFATRRFLGFLIPKIMFKKKILNASHVNFWDIRNNNIDFQYFYLVTIFFFF